MPLPSERPSVFACLTSPRSSHSQPVGTESSTDTRLAHDDHIMEAMPRTLQGQSGWYRNGNLVAYYHLSATSGQWLQLSNAGDIHRWTGELTPSEQRKLRKLLEQEQQDNTQESTLVERIAKRLHNIEGLSGLSPQKSERVVKGDCEHTEGVYQFASGAVFRGEWQDGKPHGNGIYEFHNGDVYEGQWHAGDMHGRGIFRYGDSAGANAQHSGSSGDVYDGQFQHNTWHGEGKYICRSGEIYEGTFMNDKRHGYGACKYTSGDEYEGQWRESERHGKGILRYGSLQCGDSRKAVRENENMLYPRSGDVYEGCFEHNEPHGLGKYLYKSGEVFEGAFRKGQKHGVGVWMEAPSGLGSLAGDGAVLEKVKCEYAYDIRIAKEDILSGFQQCQVKRAVDPIAITETDWKLVKTSTINSSRSGSSRGLNEVPIVLAQKVVFKSPRNEVAILANHQALVDHACGQLDELEGPRTVIMQSTVPLSPVASSPGISVLAELEDEELASIADSDLQAAAFDET